MPPTFSWHLIYRGRREVADLLLGPFCRAPKCREVATFTVALLVIGGDIESFDLCKEHADVVEEAHAKRKKAPAFVNRVN